MEVCFDQLWGRILFDLKMTFKANFFEKITASNSATKPGKYLAKAELVLPIPSLDIGKENGFIIYIQSNNSFHFSNVEMPQTASYQVSDTVRENIDMFVPDAMRTLECGSAIFEKDRS